MKYISIEKYRYDDKEITEEEAMEIWNNSYTESRGHAVYGVDEIIIGEDEDGERVLWAYRKGEDWTTVPIIFESMTIVMATE